jgi:hypothetical protein
MLPVKVASGIISAAWLSVVIPQPAIPNAAGFQNAELRS